MLKITFNSWVAWLACRSAILIFRWAIQTVVCEQAARVIYWIFENIFSDRSLLLAPSSFFSLSRHILRPNLWAISTWFLIRSFLNRIQVTRLLTDTFRRTGTANRICDARKSLTTTDDIEHRHFKSRHIGRHRHVRTFQIEIPSRKWFTTQIVGVATQFTSSVSPPRFVNALNAVGDGARARAHAH